MLIHREANFILAPTLYLLDCYRHQDIHISRPYVSSRTRLRSVGVLRHALGVHKIQWEEQE